MDLLIELIFSFAIHSPLELIYLKEQEEVEDESFYHLKECWQDNEPNFQEKTMIQNLGISILMFFQFQHYHYYLVIAPLFYTLF